MSTYRLFVYEKGPQKGLKEPEIYEGAKGRKYLRVREGGQDSMISLKTTSIIEAIKLREARQKAKTAAELGVAVEPNQAAKKAKTALTTVKTVIKRYLQDGCPNKKGVARPASKHLDAERERCETLMEFFNTETPAADLIQNDFDNFKDWRVAKVIEKERAAALNKGEEYEPDAQTGLRTVDLDLNCLNNAMRWAVRKTLLKANPAASRAHYYTKSDATHCREFAPENADELHEIAGVFMASRRSETLGWWLLYEGATGLRSEETVLLQMNARSDEPGGFTADGGSMCVRRAKKSKKFNLYVQVHEGLKLIRQAHAIWHSQRYPLSPWCFPGRSRKTSGHVDKSSLTKSLDRLYQVYVNFRKTEKDPKKFPKGPYLTRKYTSHGAGRAFYVLVRRSQEASDPQIAYELNQIGGVGTLEQVYGLPPEHWKNGNAPRLRWIATGDPAWTKIIGVDFSALQAKKPHSLYLSDLGLHEQSKSTARNQTLAVLGLLANPTVRTLSIRLYSQDGIGPEILPAEVCQKLTNCLREKSIGAADWRQWASSIRGRSRTLRINYRTSHQIRQQADRLLGPDVTDVDGNSEDRSDTISIFNGPPPVIRVLATENEEMKFVGTWLAEQSKSGILPHEFGLFVRSTGQLHRAQAAVREAGFSFKVLDEHVETTSGRVSISTMHLAKGLEFRAVAVMACDDEIIPLQSRIETVGDDADLQEVYDTERHLLYVACTRARDHLLVTSVEPASEFLDDLKKSRDSRAAQDA